MFKHRYCPFALNIRKVPLTWVSFWDLGDRGLPGSPGLRGLSGPPGEAGLPGKVPFLKLDLYFYKYLNILHS